MAYRKTSKYAAQLAAMRAAKRSRLRAWLETDWSDRCTRKYRAVRHPASADLKNLCIVVYKPTGKL